MLSPDIAQVAKALAPKPLIEALRQAFRDNALDHSVGGRAGLVAPLRSHHVIDSPTGDATQDTHLLLMPAWEPDGFMGVKMVGVNAANPSRADDPQPMVQGIYLLMSAKTGQPLAQFDAQQLTFRRTTAVSALAADYLARPDATTLGIIGAGAAIAPYLIEMYQAVRDIRRVVLWNRTASKAHGLVDSLLAQGLQVEQVATPDDVVIQADIVASCTPSDEPLIRGALLRPGMHVDCIGGFRPTMRESDDDVVRRAAVYGDTRAGVLAEAGDIMIPIARGVMTADDLAGDLFDLCSAKIPGRQSVDQITFFKSVGSALSDFAGAKLVYRSVAA